MNRIRTIKPEWLEDERLADCSDQARLLSVALLLMADDYGRGRAGVTARAKAFPVTPAAFDAALAELEGWYVRTYEVRGQRYFEVLNWAKHQRVDKPGRPLVPPPPGEEEETWKVEDFVYFVGCEATRLVKIGRSRDPSDRVKKLATSAAAPIALLGQIEGGFQENELHRKFKELRQRGEWFRAEPALVEYLSERFDDLPEWLANDSRTVRGPFAPDRDLDQDQDHDQEQADNLEGPKLVEPPEVPDAFCFETREGPRGVTEAQVLALERRFPSVDVRDVAGRLEAWSLTAAPSKRWKSDPLQGLTTAVRRQAKGADPPWKREKDAQRAAEVARGEERARRIFG